ncbi:LysR family transcriptional regulator [Ornithinimicrobium pratense]|nr:LysR family transcriptional regulator [Ornithinimicrobium pratense]
MFNPEHLRTLRTVVEEGTLVAAADLMGLTPSAVSQQLARLQQEAGQAVLVRRGRNLAPTDAAAVLVRMAEEVQRLDESARAELERLTKDVSGPLVVGAFATAVRALLPAALTDLRRAHPHLAPTIREAEPELSLDLVRGGQLDLAVVHDWTDYRLTLPAGLSTHDIGQDVVDLVAPVGMSLPRRRDGRVDLHELDGQTWIDDTPGVYSDWLLGTLREAGLSYRIGATVDTYPGKLALAGAGFGVTLVPRLGRDLVPDSVVVLPLHDPPTRRVFLAHRQAAERRPAVEAAVRAIRRAWADLET